MPGSKATSSGKSKETRGLALGSEVIAERSIQVSKRRRTEPIGQPKRTKKSIHPILDILPIEVLIEILSYAHPRDLLAFARTNRACRRLLMQLSSIRLWKRVLENVPGLPDCPPHLVEPQYVALIFTKYCTVCGVITTCRVDVELSVRLCTSCRKTHVDEVDNFSRNIKDYLPCSGLIGPQKSFRDQDCRDNVDRYCFLGEARKVEAEWLDLQANQDKLAVEEWEVKQEERLKARTQHAIILHRFLVQSEFSEQSRELVNQRRAFIEAKLSDKWDEEEYRNISPSCQLLWMTYVEQPRLITDATWKALRPKLEFILNESSDQVICEESWERQLTCSRRLTDLLFNLGRILPNALSPIATALEVNAVPASVIVARIWNKLVLTAFPNLDDALKWPCMKKFVYGEYSRQGTEDRFMARLDQIPAEVQKWDKQVIADLTLLFQKGQEAKSEVDSVPLTVGNSTEPTKHLTDDMRRLLRADCVFRATKHHTLYNVFHDTSRYGVSTPLFYPDMLLTRREEAWNPEYFQPYREAGQVAKQLLRCLNMEDAAHAQLKLMGVQFICGWCSDQNPKDWMGIIGHYLEEQRRKTRLDSRTSNKHNNHLQGLGGELVDPMVFVSNSGVEVTDASNLSRLVFRKRPWAY